MASAAKAGGTNIIVVSAPTFLTASATLLKTGLSKWIWPPLPGVTPPTNISSVLNHLGGMEGSFTTSKTLYNYFRILI